MYMGEKILSSLYTCTIAVDAIGVGGVAEVDELVCIRMAELCVT